MVEALPACTALAALPLAEMDASSLAWIIPAGAVLLAIILACVWPAGIFRLGLWLFTRSFYWLRTKGSAHVPHGGALLVCHELAGLDGLLLVAALSRRVRLVVYPGFTPGWLARRILRWVDAIVLDGNSGPAPLIEAARQALSRGELVCLTTQTVATANSETLTLSTALERITAGLTVPVLPVCVDQVWGSRARVRNNRLRFSWPPAIPYGVEVTLGTPCPAGDIVPALQKLAADAAIGRMGRRRPVHRQFVRTAARQPFRPCMFDNTMKVQLNYGKTLAGAMCLARALRPMIGEHAMVGVWLPPSIGGALTNIALALLGKTSVNLNYTASALVIQSALRQCGSRHVITSKRFVSKAALDPGPGVEPIYLEDIMAGITKGQRLRAFLMVVLLPGWMLERWVLRLGRHRPDQLATVIFSSGSTGEPKGVMLSHANIAGNIESMVQMVNFEPRDRVLGVLPFFHSFGYTVPLWTPLQVGASAVYHPDPRQAREAGDLCRTHHCTIYLSTGTFLRFCIRKCEPADFQSLRLLICGAEKLPMSLADEFEKRFGIRPVEGYGCTELSPVVATNLPDRAVDGLRLVNNRPGSIGHPIPGNAARVIDPETRQVLPTGQEGLLLITGPNVMVGYLNRPEMTAQVTMDGWYITGDVGRLDAEGYITLTGRQSRFAKVGGEMVPLERVEEELHAVLQASERICVVTCVPDEARGERLVVLHLAHEGLEVRRWCQQLGGRGLPNLWLPSERDFIRVSDLPLLGTGKVDLKRVKELALELAKK